MAYEDISLDRNSASTTNHPLKLHQVVRGYWALKVHSLYHCLKTLMQTIGLTEWRSQSGLGARSWAESQAWTKSQAWTESQSRTESQLATAGSHFDSYSGSHPGVIIQTRVSHLLIGGLYRCFMALQLRFVYLQFTIKRVMLLLRETEAVVKQVNELATAEAAIEPPVDFSQLPDIRGLGNCGTQQETIIFQDEQRECPLGTNAKRRIRVMIFKPECWRSGKTPVVVISHGLGSNPEAFSDYATHLASHGYLVALPQHPGSDAERLWRGITRQSQGIFNLEEFIDRPLDISHVLDQLERCNQSDYNNRLDLENVGVMGHSFGGYTALMLAGAEMQFDDLNTVCALSPGLPNLSLVLQCRALKLPRQTYRFRDDRVKAVLSIDPVGSEVFGAKGLARIQIPVMLVAGSEDSTTPLVFEQMRVFPWLTTPDRYLALIEGKAHVGNFSNLDATLNLILRRMTNLRGLNSSLFYSYTCSLSLAFFEVYLAGNAAYKSYLRSSYAQYLSRLPFRLSLISAASCRTASCEQIDQRLRQFVLQLSQLHGDEA